MFGFQEVQQDILETFVDRAQLRPLTQPTLLPNGKRIPGLKLDHPRQLAVMHALLRFSHTPPATPLLPPSSIPKPPRLWAAPPRPHRAAESHSGGTEGNDPHTY